MVTALLQVALDFDWKLEAKYTAAKAENKYRFQTFAHRVHCFIRYRIPQSFVPTPTFGVEFVTIKELRTLDCCARSPPKA